MEEREETVYLKQYVTQHPDNRMAWYLLGKEYMLQGKVAKANYCFLRSGELYEAFERRKHPLAEETPMETIERWNRKRTVRGLAKRSALLAVLLLGLSVSAPGSLSERIAPQQAPVAEAPVADADAPDESLPPAQAPAQAEEPVPSTAGEVGVVVVSAAEAAPIGEALARVLYDGARPAFGIAASLESAGPWRLWPGRLQPLLSVERSSALGRADVRMLDPDSCVCVPDDPAPAEKALAAWSAEREQQWVLASAIHQFRERHGRQPASIDELALPYPDNMLAGDTPYMRRIFALLTAQLAERDGAAAGEPGGGAAADGPEAPQPLNAGIADQLPDRPLEIVVDAANHRLALVSGDVIVRSYPVGLGAERTPQGTFRIVEKVKNPNGRDDGEFGSRGMTLSDERYAIHGTNEPDSIGKDESLGCIRMNRADIEELYDMTPIGTKVTIAKGVLPAAPATAQPFALEPRADETNPDKIYRWL